MSEDKPDLNVYGHNQPAEDVVLQPGVRDKGEADELDDIRSRREGKGGGMGRNETPRDEPSEGHYNREEVHALDERPDLDDTPMPPRHAPLSDEVPS